MRIAKIALLLWLVLPWCAQAEDASAPDRTLALRYLTVSRIEDTINASIDTYTRQLPSPEDRESFHKMLEASIGWDVTKNQLARLVMKIYTREELEASIAFLTSPLGASATAKNAEFSGEFSAILSTNLQKAMKLCCAKKGTPRHRLPNPAAS